MFQLSVVLVGGFTHEHQNFKTLGLFAGCAQCPTLILLEAPPPAAVGPKGLCSETSRLMKDQADPGCSLALRRKITTIVFPGGKVSLIHHYPLPFILIHVDTCYLFDDEYKEDSSMASYTEALIRSYKFKPVCRGGLQGFTSTALVEPLLNSLNMDKVVTKH